MKTNDSSRENRIDRLRVTTLNRFCDRIEKREALAEKRKLVGELERNGETVYYVWPVGGKYFESASWCSCVENLHKQGAIR